MKNILLVAGDLHTPLYRQLQAQFAVRFTAQVTTLRQAAALLSEASALPDVVLLGHDLSPAGRVVEFVRRAQSSSSLRQLRFVALVDRSAAFLAGELTGTAQTLIFQQATPTALANLLAAEPVQLSRSAALSVINVKGGTGKTSLLVNLAGTLANRGLKVVVLDADIVDGNVAGALGLEQTSNSLDRLAAEIGQGQEAHQALARFLVPRSDNLFVLPAPGRSDFAHDYLNEVTAGAIFNALVGQRFDLVLVDLPGNVRATPFMSTLAAYPNAFFYLLYPTGRTFGQKGFSGAADIIRGLNAGERGRIVVYHNGDGPWSRKQLADQWGLPVAGAIPHHPLVEQSQGRGLTTAELVASRTGLLQRTRRALGRAEGQPYLEAIDHLATWIVAHDLAGEETGP